MLDWYDRHHRSLPWRTGPDEVGQGLRTHPYRVWLSEVMLQQTTVQAVKSYFEKFTRLWPQVEDLAAAPVDEVMSAWAGLGYYARARNLKKCAEVVVAKHGGHFPETEDGLRALPGIGAYTAAAISAIAFDQPSTVVDGNVERVISRLYAIPTPLPSAKTEIRTCTAALLSAERPGDFAQAMMDLGATICTPRRPACALCPVNEGCMAFAAGNPETYPVKVAKKEKPVRTGAAYVAISPGEGAKRSIFLRKRADKGLLGGMSEVPGTEWTSRLDGASDLSEVPFTGNWQSAGIVAHVFTHFELRLTVFKAEGVSGLRNDGWWQPVGKLDEAALPTVMKKAIAAAIPDAFNNTAAFKQTGKTREGKS